MYADIHDTMNTLECTAVPSAHCYYAPVLHDHRLPPLPHTAQPLKNVWRQWVSEPFVLPCGQGKSYARSRDSAQQEVGTVLERVCSEFPLGLPRFFLLIGFTRGCRLENIRLCSIQLC